jgi:hypothetical protein
MKSLITFVSTAVALATGAILSGFALDIAVVISALFVAGIAGLFVSDYSRATTYSLEQAKAPARRAPARRPVEASPVFASLIVFNTTIA